jgi:trans-aconitate methyltransferase
MVSAYYQESVELGAQFQQNNKSWDGKDTFSYHRQIRDVAHLHNCKTVLDYGCGKGHQWTETVAFWPDTTVMSFADYLKVDAVFKYDPCVSEFATEPVNQKYDLIICNQVLPYIPDEDLEWVKHRLSTLTGTACFIGMHSKAPKAKKQIYDKQYFSVERSQEWYQEFFSDWQGSKLYWWFRDQPYNPDWINNDPD